MVIINGSGVSKQTFLLLKTLLKVSPMSEWSVGKPEDADQCLEQ